MKAYIQAEMRITRAYNDIITSSIKLGDPISSGSVTADAPERRRSIWD